MRMFVRTIGYFFFMLMLISIISFTAIHAAPNSFLSAGELNPNMSPESIAHLKAVYGLDKPLWQQYVDWIDNLIHLDFGISFVSGQEVTEVIVERLPITLTINFVTLFLVFAFSLHLGIKAALHAEKGKDHLIRQLSLISYAMPSFYLALLMILLFGVHWQWFPITGLHGIDAPSEGLGYYADMAWHLVQPIFVMVFVSLGSMIIYVRSLTLDILKSDYVFFARTRNLSDKRLLWHYILPNLMPPIVTLLGLSLPGLIGGSVILEQIFGIPGMGQLFFLSALSRDYPVIMGILMMTAFLTLLGNMAADLMLLRLNPYARQQR